MKAFILLLLLLQNSLAFGLYFSPLSDLWLTEEQEFFRDAKANWVESIEKALEKNPELVDAQDDYNGNTALIYTAREGNIEAMRSLLIAGADPNIQNRYGDTALIIAVENNNIEVADLLINSRLLPSINLDIQNDYGNTALMLSLYHNNREIAFLLIYAGADPNIPNRDRDTAIMVAFRNADIRISSRLIEAGADINAKDRRGRTMLIDFASWSQLHWHDNWDRDSDILNYLIEEIKINLDIQDDYGATALISSSYRDDTKILNRLIQAKADLDIQDDEGNTAVMNIIEDRFHDHLTEEVKKERVELLIQAGADLDLKNKDGHTAMTLAIDKGYETIVNLLKKQELSTNKN